MKLDTLIARIDSVGEVVGNFCGSPIYSLSILKIDTDAARYRRNVGVSNKLPVTDLVPLESTAEVLPEKQSALITSPVGLLLPRS
jgi:hypothetical protein